MDFSATITPFMPIAQKRFCISQKSQDSSAFDDLIANAELFSSGRDALLRLLKIAVCRDEPQRIFLPSYFCPWVIKAIQKKYCTQVCFYDDFPNEQAPDFSTLSAKANDIVVAVNYFASRDFSVWQSWKKENCDVILVGDFSHCPFAKQTFMDCFDYVFASLRKTLPLCDGGYLFGKKFSANVMYKHSGQGCDFASAYAYSAALAEIDYQNARDYYYNAEMRLNAKSNISRMSFYSYNVLKILDLHSIWEKRNNVLNAFSHSLRSDLGFAILPTPLVKDDNFASFCPTLCFEDVSLRDKAYSKLADEGILPSIYWGAKFLKCKKAKEVSATMMTISLDFRHTENDARKVAEILNNL